MEQECAVSRNGWIEADQRRAGGGASRIGGGVFATGLIFALAGRTNGECEVHVGASADNFPTYIVAGA